MNLKYTDKQNNPLNGKTGEKLATAHCEGSRAGNSSLAFLHFVSLRYVITPIGIGFGFKKSPSLYVSSTPFLIFQMQGLERSTKLRIRNNQVHKFGT